MEGNASVYHQVNPVSRISGEARAEFLRTWGPDFDQKGGGRGGKGGRARVGQVYLCVETINKYIYANATACLKTTNKIPHTPGAEETRPEDCSVYRRSILYDATNQLNGWPMDEN